MRFAFFKTPLTWDYIKLLYFIKSENVWAINKNKTCFGVSLFLFYEKSCDNDPLTPKPNLGYFPRAQAIISHQSIIVRGLSLDLPRSMSATPTIRFENLSPSRRTRNASPDMLISP